MASMSGCVYCATVVTLSAMALLMPLEVRSTAVEVKLKCSSNVWISNQNQAPPPIPCTDMKC
jgi:hypothetical protein